MLKWVRIMSFGIITLLLSCHGMLSRAEGNVETLIFYHENPPFSYQEDGQVKGLFVDVVTAIFDDMGVAYTIKTYPFKRAMLFANKGGGIVVGIIKNDEREKSLDYSSSFYIEKSVLFVSKGHGFPFNSINDLKGKRVGVKLGWSYGAEFDQATDNKLFTPIVGEPKQLYTLLQAGKLDAVIGRELYIPDLIKILRAPLEVESLPIPLLIADLYLAVKKGTKAELIEKFNYHIELIKLSGEYDNILAKYRHIN
jgi:polar amino acid transport system substrate-binding protein